MIKTKALAILLCLTTVFTAFMGVSFADDTAEDSYEIVIEDGKLISGNSELIDQGIIVLGTPEGEESTDASVEKQESADSTESTDAEDSAESQEQATADGNLMDKLISAVEQNGTRVPVKDNSTLIDNSQGATTSTPNQTPNAVNPSVPSQTPGAIEDIPSIDYTIALDSTVPSAQIFTVTATDLGDSGGAASDPNGYGYEYFGQSFRYDNPSRNSKAWMDAYNGYGYGNFYNPAGLHYNKTRIVIGQTTNANGLVANNWNIVIAGGKILEFTTSYAGKGLARAYNSFESIGWSTVFAATEKYTPMFDVANGTLRIIGPSATSPFILDANGFVQTNRVQAPIVYVGANGNAEFKNVRFQDSLLDSTTTYKNEMFINGAAIFVNGGELHLENVTFYNCETSSARNGNGGAIFIQDGIVTIKNCSFGGTGSQQDLWATQGGALYIKGNNTVVTMEGGNAVNCHAINGSTGPRGGFAYMYSGTFNVKDVTIGSTTAVTTGAASGSATSVEAQTGGAFYMSSLSTLNIQDSTIQNCKSFHNSTLEVGGGAIYVNDYDTLNTHEGEYNNTPSTTVNLKNTTIKGCVAETDGGGIFAHGGQVNIEGGSIENNRVEYTTTNVCIDAARTGGGIYASYKAEINLVGVNISSNSAYRGGGVYITRQAVVNLESGSISSNKIGGGVYLFSNSTFNLKDGTMSANQFTSRNTNHTSLYDGNSFGTAVVMQGEGTNYPTFSMSGGTISGHTNTTNTTSATGSKNLNYGGAVGSMAGGYINISGGTISGNSAGVGGGIYAIDGCTITMTGGTISNNSATNSANGSDGGGGIHAGRGTDVYIVDGIIENNSSAVSTNGGGGGISVDTPNHFFIGGDNNGNRGKPIIRNNHGAGSATALTCDGGGIYACYSGIIIYDCEITNNYATHGGGVYVTNTSGSYSVIMHNGVIDNNQNTGIFLAGSNSATSFIMHNGSISGNTIIKDGGHDYGGAGICSLNGHSVTINGGTISGNKNLDEDVFTTEDGDTARNGGGIAMVQKATGVGTLTITGGTISNNETTGDGGGIYVENGGKLSISGTASNMVTISGNKASGASALTSGNGGGGIAFNSITGTTTTNVIISYVNFSNNEALANKGDGGGIVSRGTNLTISNCTFSGNKALTANSNGGGIDFGSAGYTLNVDKCLFTSNDAFWGGAMYFSSTVTVTITNSEFYSNTARQGGGLMIYGGTITVSGCCFGDNQTTTHGTYAPDAGGAISVSGATLTIGSSNIGWRLENGEKVEAPNVGAAGGGIYVYGFIDSKPTNSKLVLNSGMNISNNRATGGGGGVCFGVNANIPQFVDVILNNNTAGGNGGGIYVSNSTVNTGADYDLELRSCTVENNTAGGNGGGIYASNTIVAINSKGSSGQGAKLKGNNAANGGGLYVKGAVTVEIEYTNFDGNNATSQGGGIATYDGASATISYTSFGYNSAGKGGAIGVLKNDETGTGSSVTLLDSRVGCLEYVSDNVEVAGNTANTVGGGIFVADGCQISFGGIVSVCNNVAGTDGGGAYFSAGATVNGCNDLTVSDNEAGGNGGGIYTAIDLTITDLIMNGNDAEVSGGGIYADNCAISIDNSSQKANLALSYNTARTGNGGGVYVSHDAVSSGKALTLKSCDLKNNTAGGNGGGVYASNVELLMNNSNGKGVSVFQNNTAAKGGAVYVNGTVAVDKDMFKISATNFFNNSATGGDGGAVCVNKSRGYIVTSIFEGNTATGNGGAVSLLGDDSYSRYAIAITSFGNGDSDATQSGNRATGNGGGVYAKDGKSLVIVRGGFYKNTAGKDGGGLMFDSFAEDVIITYDATAMQAHHSGANIGNDIDNLQAQFVLVNGNKAIGNGGGIAANSNAVFSHVSSTWNTANNGGGISINGQGLTLTADGFTARWNDAHNNGGGVYTAGGATFSASSALITNNDSLQANGGGVYVEGNGSSVTINGGYIVGNNAKGTMTGNTTMAAADSVKGVGGGVAVFDGGSFTMTGTSAIYSNIATVGANDVFANGQSTKLSIPSASAMDTNGVVLNGVSVAAFDNQGKNVGWWEDYKNSDASYENGLFGDIPPSFRYAEGPVSIPAYITAGESSNGRYINEDDRFVSITFDVQKYNVGSITITAPTAADTNQRFVFELTGETMKGEEISLTISLGSGESVTITELYPGTYTVTQKTSWSWRYSVNGVTVDGAAQAGNPVSVEVEIKGVSVTENHTVAYGNNRSKNLWLDHNSGVEKNHAVFTTAALWFDKTEAKRGYVI